MGTWSEGYVYVDGTAIHYHRTGESGPPLILLHGFLDNGLCWSRVARDLESDYAIVMIDMRHHGRSGGFVDNYSYDVLANDVAAVARALALEPAHLYGHSMGATTAMVVAAAFPELVRSVLLEDPFLPDGKLTATEPENATAQEWPLLLELRRLSPEERLPKARAVNPGWHEEEIGPWVESKIEFNFSLFSSIAGSMKYPWRETLARISSPLLVITADPQLHSIVTPERVQEMSQIWQAGEAVRISGAGHCIHRDRYEETMDIVQAFLEKH